MSEIRVTYSGLISFGSGLITLVTGLGFILIVTRVLSQQDYGIWGIINSLFVYGMIASSFINFWTIRDIARGKKVGKTALASSGLFSIVGIGIYIAAVLLIASKSLVGIEFFIIAALLLPINFLQKIISSINTGWKPQIASYGNIISGIVSIPLALFFIYFLNWSITGIIFSLVIAQSINISYQAISARKKINVKIDFEILKRWIKFSWIPTYPRLSNLAYISDVIIFTLITGSVIGISYYSAALVIAGLVGFSSGISNSIYPKLLSGDKGKIISRNLTHLSYFMIPMFFLTITFAKEGLFILNPIYEIAFLIVIFLTFRIVFFNLSSIFETFLIGKENVDNDEKSNFLKYIKSKLFFIPTLRLIQNTSYIIILAITLFVLNDFKGIMDLIIYWSIISMIFQIPLTIYLIYKTKQTFQLNFEINSIIKYLLSGIISFSIVYFLTEKFLIYNESLQQFLPQVIIFGFIGIGIYLLITYLIDKQIRDLIKSIILEIKK